MKSLFAVAGVLEILAGLAFVITPSPPAKQIFGALLDGPGESTMARVLGLALLALGFAFWRTRNDVGAPGAHGLAVTMLGFNTAVAVLLVTSAAGWRVSAPGLWPAFLVHGGLAAWCGWRLRVQAAVQKVNTDPYDGSSSHPCSYLRVDMCSLGFPDHLSRAINRA